MKLALLALEAIALLCQLASAQPIVRVIGEKERTETTTDAGTVTTISRGYGTGCCIGRLRDGRMAVLTAAHVVQDKLAVQVQWDIGDGVPITSAAEVLATDYTAKPPPATDVALLAVKMSNGKRIRLAKAHVADVAIHGFPGLLPLKTVSGYALPQYTYHDVIAVESHSVTDGMSGCPITTRDGKELVGVFYSFNPRHPTEATQTSVLTIRPFLQKSLGYVPGDE